METSLYSRSKCSISQGALTNSKRPESLIKGIYPTHVTSSYGTTLVDETGKRYTDFICGLGTNLFGYANAQIRKAVIGVMHEGACPSLPTQYEVFLAEELKSIFHWCDRWKFVKTGTEACHAAIRIARTVTGRKQVVTTGYHGWSEPFVSVTEPAFGCGSAEDLSMVTFSSLDDITTETAAVIIEPVVLDISEERKVFLHSLRRKCDEVGALLIFDEIVTGYRFEKLCVAKAWNIIPDLFLIGKAMANGFPIAAIGGKADVMDDTRWFVSGTYAGEIYSIAAAREVIKMVSSSMYSISHLIEEAKVFVAKLNAQLVPLKVQILGYGTRGAFMGDVRNKAIFWQECCLSGILFGPSFFYSYMHNGSLPFVEDAIEDVVQRMSYGALLMGDLPVSPFAAKVRNI